MEDLSRNKRRRMNEDDEFHVTRNISRWENLPSDILNKVLHELGDFDDETSNIASLISLCHCSAVCGAWRSTITDPKLWRTVDLSAVKSAYIQTQISPWRVYVTLKSELKLNCLLKTASSLSKGSTTTFIFHPDLYMSDEIFTYIAKRSPKLRRLVLPAWNRIGKNAIRKAIACWKDLESLTIEYITEENFSYLIQEISNNCKNFKELKLMIASKAQLNSIVKANLKVKVLSLRGANVFEESLIAILDGLPELEVLNVSHCRVVEALQPLPGPDREERTRVLSELNPLIYQKALRLKRFVTCMRYGSCVMCDRVRRDEGYLKWHRYEAGLWKQDEIDSLALLDTSVMQFFSMTKNITEKYKVKLRI